MSNRSAAALRAVTLAMLVMAGCAPGASMPTRSASASPIDWLLDGAGAEALGAVPGSTWTAKAALKVAALCGPTDAHEGWTLSGPVVSADDVTDGFDGGDPFELDRAEAPRSWVHLGDERLRLVEREDGRVDFELFVLAGEAPTWETVDQVEVETVLGPERCG